LRGFGMEMNAVYRFSWVQVVGMAEKRCSSWVGVSSVIALQSISAMPWAMKVLMAAIAASFCWRRSWRLMESFMMGFSGKY
jgi:hypothetical protein